ncbi:dynein intermediate chain 3, ciliary-like [Topomyia yanbarensis]|uniref:dynein intermediate chain 3, ciliary-like n=1 Tax=Topomyia yanbarensis TaxID=2498891 RepID=UPI00273CD0FA|nr:dynein intermediate chain 3, ciliary-like [Topomyia yanbarensis]
MKIDGNISCSQMQQNWTRYMVMTDTKSLRKTVEFQEENEVQASIPTNKSLAKNFETISPVEKGIQSTPWILNTPVWTFHNSLVQTGITHYEGGWPKDIDTHDEEVTARYRRKQEKSEAYLCQMKGLSKTMEHSILQNSACDIYQNYFEDVEQHELIEQFNSKTVHVYKDYLDVKRSCSYISWSDEGLHFASTHCNIGEMNNKVSDSYIWDIENPNEPLQTLVPPYQARCMEYNFKDGCQLAGGLFSGQIAIWDIRVANEPVEVTLRETSHKDVVTKVLWTGTKTSNEFLSGSTDGRILWWDMRNLNEPYDYLNLAPKDAQNVDPKRCFGVCAVEFEQTMPNKYTVGTENGIIYSCSRKYKTPADKIQALTYAHTGPVYSVERNPLFIKNYISVGDWQTKIWTEDCRDSPIVWTKEYAVQLTCGVWSPTRCSLVFICRMDGVMDAWDVIHRLDGPVLRIKLSDVPLLALRVHKSGKLIANGTESGAIYLTEISDNLTFSSANDKPALSGMLEREMRRQRLLEAKIKEMKLKEKELERERIRRQMRMEKENSIEDEERDLVYEAQHQFWTKIHGRKSLRTTLKGLRMRDAGVNLLKPGKKLLAVKKEDNP